MIFSDTAEILRCQRVYKINVYTLTDEEKRTQTRKLSLSTYEGTEGDS